MRFYFRVHENASLSERFESMISLTTTRLSNSRALRWTADTLCDRALPFEVHLFARSTIAVGAAGD